MRPERHDATIRARIVALYDAGVSFSRIAGIVWDEFGRRMTREAVAGVTFRENQKRGGRPTKSVASSPRVRRPSRKKSITASAAAADQPAATAPLCVSPHIVAGEPTRACDVSPASRPEALSMPSLQTRPAFEYEAADTSDDDLLDPPDGDLDPEVEDQTPGHVPVIALPAAIPGRPSVVATAEARAIASRPRALDVTRLSHGDCRYPSDEIDARGRPFIGFRCAEPALVGKPWCDHHYEMVYQKKIAKPQGAATRQDFASKKASGLSLRSAPGRAA